MAEQFKRLDRKLVYHGHIVDFYEDTMQVPNGNVVKWDFIKHNGAAAVVPVLDDGRITDSQGRTVDFKNTILIMTSNIGAQYLLDGVREDGTIDPACEAAVMNDLRSHFRPEFFNRLDEIIMFKPLTRDNVGGIVDLIMQDLNRRLADRELHVRLTPEAKTLIIRDAYDPTYGARPLKRYIQKNVETLAARLILEDGVQTGDTIEIYPEQERLMCRAVRQE